MREDDVTAADGTVLRAWRHGRGKHAVLGVATIPELWPTLPAPETTLQVHSWLPRGGRHSPGNGAITVDDHVSDAVAVLDAAGVQRCVVVGWSLGVSIGATLALRHPHRVAGLLLLAGLPSGLGGLAGEPAGSLGSSLAGVLTRGLRLSAPLLDTVLPWLPVSPAMVWPLRQGSLLRPAADPADTARVADRVLRRHWHWLARLTLTVATSPPPDLRGLTCPVTMLVGRHDMFTDLRRAAATLASVPQARLRILPTSHFIPLEAPQVVLDEIRALQRRADAVQTAVRAVHDGPLTNGLRRGT